MIFKFKYLLGFSALAIASCGGYYSVFGLSMLFSGSRIAVIIMGFFLELCKVVGVTTLHKYWDKLSKGLIVYLTSAVLILMVITSLGIYGFLSFSYLEVSNKYDIHNAQLNVLTIKKESFNKSILDNEKIIATKNKRYDQLTNYVRPKEESRLDSAKTNRNRNIINSKINEENKEIENLSNDIGVLTNKNNVLSDSVNKYNFKHLELTSSGDDVVNVGPLIFISNLTGIPMNRVVNYLILLIIVVFDPLGVALLLATNKAFDLDNLLESTPVPTPKILKTEEPIEEPSEGVIEVVSEGVTEEPIEEEEILPDGVQEPAPVAHKKEPVITTGKIELKDIKEIKESDRGYSVDIPKSKIDKDKIERIGSNKHIKNDDNNKVFFKRRK